MKLLSSIAIAAGALATTTTIAVVARARHGSRPADAQHTQAASVQPSSLIPADADPCAWVSRDEVEKLVGRLAGPPWRGHSASNVEPSPDGRACAYRLAAIAPGAEAAEEIAIEVNGEDAMTNETALQSGDALAARVLGAPDDTTSGASGDHTTGGWDYSGGLPTSFTGRIGHVAITIEAHTQGNPFSSIPSDSIARLAALVRDRLPDTPMASPRWHSSMGEDRDPCSLLSRDDAERVVGKLAFAPYRSTSDTPLAEPTGEACSYYLGRHRALTIRPEWTQGKTLFGVAVGASQMFAAAASVKTTAADTLDGPWDQAGAGLDGILYFLKGDRMLAVTYRTAGIDAAGAVRLASIAVERLAR